MPSPGEPTGRCPRNSSELPRSPHRCYPHRWMTPEGGWWLVVSAPPLATWGLRVAAALLTKRGTRTGHPSQKAPGGAMLPGRAFPASCPPTLRARLRHPPRRTPGARGAETGGSQAPSCGARSERRTPRGCAAESRRADDIPRREGGSSSPPLWRGAGTLALAIRGCAPRTSPPATRLACTPPPARGGEAPRLARCPACGRSLLVSYPACRRRRPQQRTPPLRGFSLGPLRRSGRQAGGLPCTTPTQR